MALCSPVPTCNLLPALGLQHLPPTANILHGLWILTLSSSWSHSKHFNHKAISPIFEIVMRHFLSLLSLHTIVLWFQAVDNNMSTMLHATPELPSLHLPVITAQMFQAMYLLLLIYSDQDDYRSSVLLRLQYSLSTCLPSLQCSLQKNIFWKLR